MVSQAEFRSRDLLLDLDDATSKAYLGIVMCTFILLGMTLARRSGSPEK